MARVTHEGARKRGVDIFSSHAEKEIRRATRGVFHYLQ